MAGPAAPHHDEGMTNPDPTIEATGAAESMASEPTPSSARREDTLDRFFAKVRDLGIVRRSDDRWLSGSCSGIAAHYGVDPLLVRAATVGLAILGGLGFTLYVLAWALLPDSSGRIRAEDGIRDGDAGGIVLLVLIALGLLPHGSGWAATPFVLLAVAAVVWAIVAMNGQRGSAPVTAPSTSGSWQSVATAPPPPPTGAPTTTIGAPLSGPTTVTTGAPVSSGYPARVANPSRPPREPRPPRTPRPRRPGGFAVTLLGAGLAVLAYQAGSNLAVSQAWTQGTPEFFGVLWALVAASATALVVGLRGWRAPMLGLTVVVLAFATATSSFMPSVPWRGGVGDHTFTPTVTLAPAYTTGVGELDLDLTQLPPSALDGARTSIRVGAGSVTIRVPKGVHLVVDAQVGLGSLTVESADGRKTFSRDGGGFSTTADAGSGTRTVHLDLQLGLGEATIKEQS